MLVTLGVGLGLLCGLVVELGVGVIVDVGLGVFVTVGVAEGLGRRLGVEVGVGV